MITHGDTVATDIGRAVREARRAQGLRQDELALVAAVSTRAVHQVEAGKPTSRLDVIERIVAALGLRLGVEQRPDS